MRVLGVCNEDGGEEAALVVRDVAPAPAKRDKKKAAAAPIDDDFLSDMMTMGHPTMGVPAAKKHCSSALDLEGELAILLGAEAIIHK